MTNIANRKKIDGLTSSTAERAVRLLYTEETIRYHYTILYSVYR